MNPYHSFVASFAQLFASGKSLPLGGVRRPHRKPSLITDAPMVIIFSPHPDDECLIGGLALRLMREAGLRIINVAVTQGSNPERQRPRWQELKHACGWLGFESEQTAPDGLEKINSHTRTNVPHHWRDAVKVMATALIKHLPRTVFVPHELDWNRTHIGAHFLVVDAVKMLPADFQCPVIETEYWAPLSSPNPMVESSTNDVADLLAALLFHVGEVNATPITCECQRGCRTMCGAGLNGAAGKAAWRPTSRLPRSITCAGGKMAASKVCSTAESKSAQPRIQVKFSVWRADTTNHQTDACHIK